jgi:hypothetical protein
MVITRRYALGLVPLLAAAAAAAGKKKTEKLAPGIAEIVEITVRRVAGERLIAIEGRVRNAGEKPIKGLTLVFSILGPNGQEVSRQRGTLDEGTFEPGAESEFYWQMKDHARAVEILVKAVGGNDFDVAVRNAGPYAIE